MPGHLNIGLLEHVRDDHRLGLQSERPLAKLVAAVTKLCIKV